MTDLKIKRIFWSIGNFTVTDYKFWRICLVNISVGTVTLFLCNFRGSCCLGWCIPLGTLGLHFIILVSGNNFSELFHLGLHQNILADSFLVICRICISCLSSHNIRNHCIRKFWGIFCCKEFMSITSKYSRELIPEGPAIEENQSRSKIFNLA